jgi:hypothetical protein
MKNLDALALLLAVATLAWMLPAPAFAADYTPATTVIVYVHGHDGQGYLREGVYGDDFTGALDVVNQLASLLNVPTWQTGPTSPNHVAACTYYGDEAPAWYAPEDVAEDAATPVSVPRYALRVAKYIEHCIDRSGATGVTVISGSFGGEVTRYMIEHDLQGLASSQKIVRWIPITSIVAGCYAAGLPEWVQELLGDESPEVDDMTYAWVDSHISARRTMNTALYGPMLITQYVGSADSEPYILTTLTNDPNDGVLLVDDARFAGYTTSDALHPTTEGALQMPGLSYLSDGHFTIASNPGVWAGACAAATGRKRITMKMTRFRSSVNGDILGPSEWAFRFQVTSPKAAELYGITDPIEYMNYSGGVSPLIVSSAGETKTPNARMFDQLVLPGEQSVNVRLDVYELDWHTTYYDMYEPGPGATHHATFTPTIATTGDSVVTVANANISIDLTTKRRFLY